MNCRFLMPSLAACLLWPLPLRAWGREGHAEIARIAQAHLSEPALAQVQMLLKHDLNALGEPSGRRTLAEVASWPDELRSVSPKHAYQGWHGRANPVCGEALGPCPGGNCVDELIERFGRVLQDPRRPLRERNEALKWVVHLIGDLHQPLHAGVAEDHGQTPVRTIRGRNTRPDASLHSVWDGQLARIALRGWQAPTRMGEEAKASSPRQWLLESRAVALANVYQALPGFSCRKPMPPALDLDADYVQQAVPAVRLQVARAGFRLADKLNLWLSIDLR